VTETLHIFLSGFRRAYRVAALNAVCAPIGSSQTFEYSLNKNISDEITNKLSKMTPGGPVFITFVDRFAEGGYRYLPVRHGKFLAALNDSGKVQITICFGIWPVLKAPSAFNQWAIQTLVPLGAPRLVEKPSNENDGAYVLSGSAVDSQLFEPSGDGWQAVVERLSEVEVLKTSDSQTVIFARLDVLEVNTNTTAQWDPISSLRIPKKPSRYVRKPMLRLKRSSSYRARVNYFFPLQRANQQAEVPYSLTLSAGLEPGAPLLGSVAALSRAQEFDFKIASLTQRSRESIQLQFGPAPPDLKGLVAPHLELPIEPQVSAALLFWIVVIGLLWIAGSGIAAQAAETTGEFRFGFYVGPLIQYLGIIAMFRIFGIKIT